MNVAHSNLVHRWQRKHEMLSIRCSVTCICFDYFFVNSKVNITQHNTCVCSGLTLSEPYAASIFFSCCFTLLSRRGCAFCLVSCAIYRIFLTFNVALALSFPCHFELELCTKQLNLVKQQSHKQVILWKKVCRFGISFKIEQSFCYSIQFCLPLSPYPLFDDCSVLLFSLSRNYFSIALCVSVENWIDNIFEFVYELKTLKLIE